MKISAGLLRVVIINGIVVFTSVKKSEFCNNRCIDTALVKSFLALFQNEENLSVRPNFFVASNFGCFLSLNVFY